MKIITIEQTKLVMGVLEKYNVGVMDYSSISKMFSELPESPVTNQEVAEYQERVEEVTIDKK